MKDVPLSGVLSIVVGVLILLLPQLLSYIIGVYLVIVGIMAIVKR